MNDDLEVNRRWCQNIRHIFSDISHTCTCSLYGNTGWRWKWRPRYWPLRGEKMAVENLHRTRWLSNMPRPNHRRSPPSCNSCSRRQVQQSNTGICKALCKNLRAFFCSHEPFFLPSTSRIMADEELRCFVGGLSWNTDQRMLMDEFQKYNVIDSKVCCLVSQHLTWITSYEENVRDCARPSKFQRA